MYRAGNLVLILLFLLPIGFVDANEIESKKTSGTAGNRSSVSITPLRDIKEISEQIDALVDAQLKEHGQKRNKLSDDEVFLRRIYLDVAGRIPTLKETRQFLNSKDKEKRAALIDQLLDSYGYVSRQYNFFADLLRIKSRQNQIVGQPYIDFVKDSLEENKPYNQFVRELLVAEGPMISRDNGAVGYYLRDRNMPEDNMSNTIRVFLGTRLECAQCHDHPFDVWTQKQYYEMVAFTGGVMTRLNRPDSENYSEIAKLRRKNDLDDREKAALRRMVLPMTMGVSGSGTGLARLPENFLGDEGDDFDIVTAKTMFEGKELVESKMPSGKNAKRVNKRFPQRIQGVREIDSRFAYADWLTSSENPRFTQVIANRLWKQAMGLGLIEPVDDITAKTRASNPELMSFLTQTMVDLDYDMKQFLRAVYNSKTYQASAMASDISDPNQFYFNGPVVRRMTAEQIWDSLLTLTIADVDQRLANPAVRVRGLGGKGNLYEQYAELRTLTADELVERAKGYGKGNAMMQMRDTRAKQRKLQKQKDDLAKRMRQARKDGDRELLASLMKEKDEIVLAYRQSSMASQLNRASEVASPAPAGHFLREFGQSDRETIENANVEPAVTQALSLMNGFLETRIADNKSTVLMQNLIPARTGEQAVNIVYLSMLNRLPSRGERTIWANDFKKLAKEEVISDLIWTLANTNEFIFVK